MPTCATFIILKAFATITHHLPLLNEHARDPKTGLLYHGWDESKQERWADKQTGPRSFSSGPEASAGT